MASALKKKWIWLVWLALNLVLGSYYAWGLITDEKSLYLPGKTTSGHYQIELACDACHGETFAGTNALQKACVNCHGAELKKVDDSHPKSKFTDPRNADRTAILDARTCITCHKEHDPQSTHTMGVTLPDDFCAFCHSKIEKDRPSHKGMAFDTCASAGCHNFHDNKALYEDFLVKHMDEPATLDTAILPERNYMVFYKDYSGRHNLPSKPLSKSDAQFPGSVSVKQNIIEQWAATSHAKRGVNCDGCHQPNEQDHPVSAWIDKPTELACKNCHELELAGFYAGKHGMRLAQKLPPMQVSQARQPMDNDNTHDALGCSSCHDAHEYRTQKAAVDSCMQCHKDDHTLAYKKSKHYALVQQELNGLVQGGSGVTCATCHLPRVKQKHKGVERIVVQHNQNRNLRPNEKMIREVCMNCHGLGFSIDALADPKLIANNFQGKPSQHIKSIQMAKIREIEQAKKKQREKQSR
ncbi:MAG: cytochrome c3 family protein [Gammaproteobacteria bacterium]